MSVTAAISVLGRFHAFYLARQLEQRGALGQLITSYPRFEVAKYGIPANKATCFPLIEGLRRGWQKLPRLMKPRWDLQHTFNRLHDRRAAAALRPEANVFVGWSSSSLETLRRAKQLGMVGIIERGSSHMSYQMRVLQEEADLAGTRFTPNAEVVATELQEYAEADFIAIPSRFVKRTFLQHGVPEHKLIHAPYGADLAQFQPQPRRDDVFRVIHCGALSLRKGVHYLLQAFHELNLPKAELWLVGGVWPEIEPYLARYRSDRIVVHGAVPQARLPWFYSQADVSCLASIEEGLALVILQAMACHRPVICTTNTGGDDVIEDGREGFMIPIRSVDAIKEKLLGCYDHRAECRAMGEAARRRVETGFGWNDYGDRILAAYARALHGTRPIAAEVG